ncbi:MAG: DUF1802 family protein [Candidatus Rokuibacteriota bacterium]
MLTSNDVALKEWAVICHMLASGRQIVLVRKGGIREPARGFDVEHREFVLVPTYFHERAEDLAEPARTALPEVARAAPPAGELHLTLYATVAHLTEVHELESLRALHGQHALSWPAVESRFQYRRPGLHLIALRVHRLARPVIVPNLARYDGCRSWVSLDRAVPVAGGEPVLDDDAFSHRLAALRRALPEDPQAARSGRR